MQPSPAFAPTASWDVLRQRAEMLAVVRQFFAAEDYWEVETPLLSRDVCVDAWLDPFEVNVAGQSDPWYLQTSPEFAMKRLLAAGADSIYQLTRSFRAGEYGSRHNHEFTILEWYRQGVTHHQQMDFVERLVRAVQQCRFTGPVRNSPELPETIPRLAYDDAFLKITGTRVLSLPLNSLQELVRRYQLHITPELAVDRDGLLNLLLAEVIEPELQRMGAVFLYDYPASQSALARVTTGNPPVAERFELYLDGMEICNGYHEVVDAAELRLRFGRQNALRVQCGKPALPVDSELLNAMEHGLPPSSGVALGLDRLVMWRLDRRLLQDVIAFPAERA